MEAVNNLILGSSGFVGKYLCNYLINKGENVITFDNVSNFDQDCRNKVLPLKDIDRVYFLAWKVGGAKYLYDSKTQQEQFDWNIEILTNVFKQLNDVPFVFVSSQLAENCNTVYGLLKRLGEMWTKLKPNGVSIRLWNVYGAFEKSTIKSHVMADFVHQALRKNEIQMMTSGKEIRQFIHIEDVCDALYNSFNYLGQGPFDITTFKWSPIIEIAYEISKITMCNIIPGNIEGSSVIMENKIPIPNWKSKIDLKEGIERTIKLFKSELYLC